MRIKLAISPSHSILTPGRPVPAPGRVASGMPNFEVTGMTGPGTKSPRERDSNPGSSALEVDALTTRPTRRVDKGTHVCTHALMASILPLSSGGDRSRRRWSSVLQKALNSELNMRMMSPESLLTTVFVCLSHRHGTLMSPE